MNNDIKEILDGLNVVIKQEGSLELDFKECKKILDCITNLQEERDFYKCTDNMNLESNIILRDRIEKALDYIPKFRDIVQSNEPALTCLKVLENILKGGNNE